MERKVRRHLATQSSIIKADVNQKSSGKWTEQCILASDKPPYRIAVGLMRQRASKRVKIQPVERAATKNSTLEASSRWRPTGNLPTKFARPWKSRGKKSDPEWSDSLTLLRAGQLACLDLLTTLPPQNKTEYVVKMYSLIQCTCKFNTLRREIIERWQNPKELYEGLTHRRHPSK